MKLFLFSNSLAKEIKTRNYPLADSQDLNLSKIPREYCYLNKKKQKPEGYFTILNEPCMDLFKSSVRRDMS
jgi:hypothetical protein